MWIDSWVQVDATHPKVLILDQIDPSCFCCYSGPVLTLLLLLLGNPNTNLICFVFALHGVLLYGLHHGLLVPFNFPVWFGGGDEDLRLAGWLVGWLALIYWFAGWLREWMTDCWLVPMVPSPLTMLHSLTHSRTIKRKQTRIIWRHSFDSGGGHDDDILVFHRRHMHSVQGSFSVDLGALIVRREIIEGCPHFFCN